MKYFIIIPVWNPSIITLFGHFVKRRKIVLVNTWVFLVFCMTGGCLFTSIFKIYIKFPIFWYILSLVLKMSNIFYLFHGLQRRKVEKFSKWQKVSTDTSTLYLWESIFQHFYLCLKALSVGIYFLTFLLMIFLFVKTTALCHFQIFLSTIVQLMLPRKSFLVNSFAISQFFYFLWYGCLVQSCNKRILDDYE